MSLKSTWNVQDFRRVAKRKLPKIAFDFLDGGVLDEKAKNGNRLAYSEYSLRPSALFDQQVDTKTNIFGVDLDLPFIISPMGSLTLFHNSSDVGLARAAAHANTIFTHSVVSSVSIEETVENLHPERVWAQMSFRETEVETLRYLNRIKKLGIRTIVLNAETRATDNREIDFRNGLQRKGWPPNPPLSGMFNILFHPTFLLRIFLGRGLTRGDYEIDGRKVKMRNIYSILERFKGITWSQIERIRELWDGNLVIKGIMNPGDAERVIKLGADAVWVSNLGGRHFDQAPATLRALPEISQAVKALDPDFPIIFDGGVRRGSDIVKALALGADVIASGRPFAFALGAYGERGAGRFYALIHEELKHNLTNVGVARPADLSEDVLIRNASK